MIIPGGDRLPSGCFAVQLSVRSMIRWSSTSEKHLAEGAQIGFLRTREQIS
jgi:hypothetical protein